MMVLATIPPLFHHVMHRELDRVEGTPPADRVEAAAPVGAHQAV
jgi:hypothetical protein